MPERGFSAKFSTDLFECPCESPIEEIFAWEGSKYLDDSVLFENQVTVNTEHGQFRIDFVLARGDEKVAIECDGHDFHNGLRDEFRDAILLGEGHFPVVYHFRGCDLTYYPEDCLWLMSLLDPNLFSERGRLNLNQLHKLEIVDSFTSGESYMLRGREQPTGFERSEEIEAKGQAILTTHTGENCIALPVPIQAPP